MQYGSVIPRGTLKYFATSYLSWGSSLYTSSPHIHLVFTIFCWGEWENRPVFDSFLPWESNNIAIRRKSMATGISELIIGPNSFRVVKLCWGNKLFITTCNSDPKKDWGAGDITIKTVQIQFLCHNPKKYQMFLALSTEISFICTDSEKGNVTWCFCIKGLLVILSKT